MLGHAIRNTGFVGDHPTQVPLAFTLQPLMPLICGFGDDPAVPLSQNPAKVRSVVVSVDRSACEAVQQFRRCVLPEDVHGTVHVHVHGKNIVPCVKECRRIWVREVPWSKTKIDELA